MMKNEWGGSKQAGFCRFSIAQQPAPEYYEAVEQGEEHVYHMVVPVKSALSTKKKKKTVRIYAATDNGNLCQENYFKSSSNANEAQTAIV